MSIVKRVANLVTVVAALMLVAGTAWAQSSGSAEVPRTPWGTPDLGGIFDYSSITPMQRPENLADQEYLTEEQAAALEQASIDRDEAMVSAPVQRSEAGDLAGANGHAWQWGLEFGNQVVADRRTSRIIDPPNGRYPARTEAAQADAARRRGFGAILPADDYFELGQGDRCQALHGLPLSPLPYNNLVQLFQTEDYFVIYAEAFRTWRIAPISDQPHGVLAQRTGDLRAHWEGDTLVVESTLYSHRLQQLGGSGPGLRTLTERFTRQSEDLIRYEYSVDDPTIWIQPWTAAISLRSTVGPMFEVACHEGNYAVPNILRGARFQDGTPDAPVREPGIICWDCEAPQ
jgi:hypothetical protein